QDDPDHGLVQRDRPGEQALAQGLQFVGGPPAGYGQQAGAGVAAGGSVRAGGRGLAPVQAAAPATGGGQAAAGPRVGAERGGEGVSQQGAVQVAVGGEFPQEQGGVPD